MVEIEIIKRDLEKIQSELEINEMLVDKIKHLYKAYYQLAELNYKKGEQLLKENNSMGEHYISEGNNYNGFGSVLVRLLNGDSLNDILEFVNIPLKYLTKNEASDE